VPIHVAQRVTGFVTVRQQGGLLKEETDGDSRHAA